jgi:hypothetical protein
MADPYLIEEVSEFVLQHGVKLSDLHAGREVLHTILG